MKNKFVKSLLCLSLMFCTVVGSGIVNVSAAETKAPIYQCDGGFGYVNSVDTTKRYELAYTSERWVEVGDSISYIVEENITASNSANITLVPDFLEYGFSTSHSLTKGVQRTVTNNTPEPEPVKIYKVYNNVKCTIGTYIGDGTCQVSTKTLRGYKGILVTCVNR